MYTRKGIEGSNPSLSATKRSGNGSFCCIIQNTMLFSPFSMIDFGWIVLLVAWTIGSVGNKRTVKLERPGEQLVVFLLFIASAGLLFSNGTTATFAESWIGVALEFVSVAFAIWARATIGKNWSGAVVTLKEDHQLVTGGPYAYVRHPIYTGFLGAGIGTALVVGSASGWLGVLAMLLAFFIRIPREESLMTAQFPAEYPAYKARTKALIPFLF
jgi:protein-S-isoprenylcysteine O-methyltransferase Ste14